MPSPLPDQILDKLDSVAELYYRLVLLVGPTGAGKTAALQAVRDRAGVPLLNVNLELSRRLLELTERQRILQLPRLLSHVVDGANSAVALLDNTEVLFDVRLKQDPLRVLQGISRNRTVVAAWSGKADVHYLFYATPGHPEYQRYQRLGLVVVEADAVS